MQTLSPMFSRSRRPAALPLAALLFAALSLAAARADPPAVPSPEAQSFATLCVRAENHPDKWPDFIVGLQHGWSHSYGDFVADPLEGFPAGADLAVPWTPWDWQNPAAKSNRESRLWLRGVLPDVPYPDKSLLLANFQCDAFAVFLDGNCLYQNGSFEPQQWIPSRPARRLHLVSLPSDSAGKLLHVLFFSAKPERLPPPEPIVLFAAQSLLVRHLVGNEWRSRSFGYFFLIVGLYALLAFFIRRRYRIAFSPWFAFMAIFLGLSELCSSNVMYMLSDRSEWLFHVNVVSFLLFPVGLWLFVEQTFGPGWNRLVRRCWQLQLLVAAVLWPADLFGWLSFTERGQWIVFVALGLQTLVGLHAAVVGILRRKGYLRVVAAGLVVFALTGLVDIATTLVPFLPETEIYLWGALALVLAMAWQQERSGGEAHVRLRNQTEELRRHQHRLEELVENRTAELRRATLSAQAASRAKSEFLANMSHELRTPLNAILGYAQLLRRDPAASAEQRERAAIVQQSGEHLLTVINDVLDVSKIEAGKLEISPAELRLLPLLKGIADMVAPRARAKSVEFSFLPDPSLPDAVVADEKRLRQILLNLLGNAVKFTESGSVRFSAARSSGILRFRVSDSGVGIAPEHLESIFEPFVQIPGKALNEGTGLGLAISRRIARKMGGDVSVQSVPGQGSVFTLEIPCAVSPALPSPESSPAPFPSRILGRCLVLVADDRPENRSVLRAMLEPLGFDVAEAANGRIALDLARSLSPALVLMDLLMPELDGFQAARLLKADPALASIPVVAVSASVYDQTQAESLCAGCDGFLPKPVDFDSLLALLRSLLPGIWSPSEPAPEAPPPEPVAPPRPLPPEFSALRDAALIGDVLQVLAETNRLLPLFPAHAPFLARVRQLAAAFEIVSLQRLLPKE